MESLPLLKDLRINIEPLEGVLFNRRNVSVHMLRLDAVHPVVSGNKIFKLHYFLEEARASHHRQIITFGGAWSNHLAATACACKEAGIKCIGFVRGEKPGILSDTLLFCIQNNMQLEFLDRSAFKKIKGREIHDELVKKYGDHTLIPEGGYAQKGARGAALIYQYFNPDQYTHICCPLGSATTFAGLIIGNRYTALIGFPVLKNLRDINERLTGLGVPLSGNFSIKDGYHFGGYAKKSRELITFMNSFYEDNKIGLDFVYTAKMMFGLYDLIEKGYFAAGSKIVCIHTGGLQGNASLPTGTLNF